ncbi:MAG: hypothetical protein ACLPXB_05660 [Thiobacillaceae bacterium]
MYAKQTYEEKPIPMKDFDPQARVKVLRKVLESIAEPRRRNILTTTSPATAKDLTPVENQYLPELFKVAA